MVENQKLDKQIHAAEKVYSEPLASSEVDILAELRASFSKLSKISDPLKREYQIVTEAKRFDISVEDYRRLFKETAECSPFRSTPSWIGLREKKLWDILQLLIVPLLLFGISVGFQSVIREQENAAKRREKYSEEDRARQESLGKYFDSMKDLMLTYKLRAAQSDAEVRTIARAKTLTALRELDGQRKGQLIKFLKEANLINQETFTVDLSGADFRGADLSFANLSGANLVGVDLTGANLSKTSLNNANLTGAKLAQANLDGTNLDNANLEKAELSTELTIVTQLCNTRLQDGKLSTLGCPPKANFAYVNTPGGAGLNVRSGPGFGYAIIYGLADGSVVSIDHSEVVFNDGYQWVKLEAGGWVIESYLATNVEQSSVKQPKQKLLPNKSPSPKQQVVQPKRKHSY